MTMAFSFLLAFLLSAALVAVIRAVALRLGYSVKSEARPLSRPRARFGGAAIGLSLIICSAGLGLAPGLAVLLVCSGALLLLGAASDLLGLKSSTKLLVQIAIASVFLFFDYRLHWAQSMTMDSILTVFWIVGITSAFDLLDTMDGLCAGIALIAGTAFLITLFPVEAGGPLFVKMQYLAVLLGAIAGFLPYNIQPASVQMGESGSLLIGLNMAAMTLQVAGGRGSDLLSVVAVPLLLLLVPIVDAMLSTASGPGRGHSSHRLVAVGLSERAAVGLLCLLAAVSGAIAVATERMQEGVAGILGAIFTIAIAVGALYLSRVRVHEEADRSGLRGTVVPLGIELGYRWRIVEVLLDLLLVPVAYYSAYRLRFEGAQYVPNFAIFLNSLPIVLGTQMVALFVVGAYRGVWRYFGLSDGVTFAKGVALGVVMAQALLVFLYRFEGYSQSVFVIYAMLLLLLLIGSRSSFRLISEFVQRQRREGERIVIYGAGDAGVVAIRHLLNDVRGSYRILGFVDDNVRKRNVRMYGYAVIGGYDHLVGLIMAGEVDVVAVTTPSPADTTGLAWLCAKYGVRLRRLEIDWREIRPLDVSDAAVAEAGSRVVRFTGSRASAGSSPDPRSPDTGPRGQVPAVAPATSSSPVRVVHVITRLILGGAQEDTLYLAIAQHGDPRLEVTLVCGIDEAGEGNMFTMASRAGVNTVVLPSLVREIRPLTDVRALFDLYRFLRAGSYTIVHTHSTKAGIIGRLAARAAGVPVVVHTLHGLAFHDFQASWKNWLYIALKRLCAPMTHKLISVSDRVTETALARGIGGPDQYVTIHSGIELDMFLSVGRRLSVQDAKRRAGIPGDAPVVGKIARLFPLKGHEQFLAAAAEVAKVVPDAHFLLVGDGPLRNDLLELAKRLGLGDRVVMAGRVPPDAVAEYIQAMDVVLHTSLREGIPRVLPQAGAVGKPVVTFELDGAPEVIRDGISGYLVPPVDVHAIALRTIELLGDADRRRAFGEAARAFASEHFSVEQMVERTNAIYWELLAGDPEARLADAASWKG